MHVCSMHNSASQAEENHSSASATVRRLARGDAHTLQLRSLLAPSLPHHLGLYLKAVAGIWNRRFSW